MKKHTCKHKRLLPLLALIVLIMGIMACNLSNQEGEEPFSEPTLGEEEPSDGDPFPEAGESSQEEEPPPGEEFPDEVRIEFDAERTHLNPGECTLIFWNTEGGFSVNINGNPVESSGEHEVCLEETTILILGVDMGEAMEERAIEIFVEDEPGGEQPLGESPPEADPSQGDEPRTDLAVTDIYPDNLPHGKFFARITNHGPDTLNNFKIDFHCLGTGVSWGGAEFGVEHIDNSKSVNINLAPGQTESYDTGLKLDANLYQYEMICEVMIKSDPDESNNVYMETIPLSNSGSSGSGSVTPTTAPAFSADFAITDLYITKNVNGSVFAHVTNHGPGNAVNVNFHLECSAGEAAYTSGALWLVILPWKVPIQNASLTPGQTKEYDVNYIVDTTQQKYTVECTVNVGWTDADPSNNTYSEPFPPPP